MEAEPQCAPASWERRATVSVLRSRPSPDRRIEVWHNPEFRTEMELFRQEMDALHHMCSVLENFMKLRLEIVPQKAVKISMRPGLDTWVIEPVRDVT